MRGGECKRGEESEGEVKRDAKRGAEGEREGWRERKRILMIPLLILPSFPLTPAPLPPAPPPFQLIFTTTHKIADTNRIGNAGE